MFTKMRASSFYVLVVTLALASALPWDGPLPTPVNNLRDLGWTPMPTPEPAVLFKEYYLQRRQTSSLRSITSTSIDLHSTCGFLSGAADNAFTCISTGWTCAIDSAHSVFGCCSILTDCTIKTSCVPQSALSSCGPDCQADKWLIKCNPTYQFCNYNILYASGSPLRTNWYCDSTLSAFTQYVTATDGSKPAATFVTVNQDISTKPITTSTSSTSTTTSTPIVSTTTIQPLTTTPPIPTPTPEPGTSTPVGAIAGGVVGGVAVIIAACLAIFCCLRRRKNKETPASVPIPGPDPAVHNYQPVVAEKEASVPVTQVAAQQPKHDQGGRSEIYTPPHSPAPEYQSPVHPQQHQLPYGQQGHQMRPVGAGEVRPVGAGEVRPVGAGGMNGQEFDYPRFSEMDASGLSAHAAPGSY